jgi:hypothetical protein
MSTAAPLTPDPSPARGEGRRLARNALLAQCRNRRYHSPLVGEGLGVRGIPSVVHKSGSVI